MKQNREKILETILVLVLACIVFGWILNNRFFFLAAFAIGCLGLFIPIAAEKIDWLWKKFAYILGTIMNGIILMLIYIVILLPLALIARASGKLSIRLKPSGKTHFRERNFLFTKESMERMW